MSLLDDAEFSKMYTWKPTMREIAFEWGLPIKKTSSRKKYRKRFRQAAKIFNLYMYSVNTELAFTS